jgi:glycine cleavage system regulatory protein
MLTSLVVSIVAPDRPGIVSEVSNKAAEFGGNWADSVMASMAGHFAGILHLQVPTANADLLVSALKAMASPSVQISVARSLPGTLAGAPAAAVKGAVKLDLVGQDRPGIIHAISAQLSRLGISIVKLQTRITSGAMSGENMFHMNAQLQLPANVDEDALRTALEGLANELMVDISLDE